MLRALNIGLRSALAHWPSAVVLFAAVTIPAGLVGYVFQTSFVGAFGRSAALESLSEGWVYTTLLDLVTQNGYQLSPVLVMSAAFLVLSLPLQSFLTAGMLSALNEHGPWSSRAFFAGAARHVGGFLLVSVLTVALVLLIGVLTAGAAGLVVMEAEQASSPGVLAVLAIGLILIAAVVTLGDVARIHLVHDPERGVLGSILGAGAFLLRHAGGTSGLVAVLAFASVLPLAGVVVFEDTVPAAVGRWLVPLVVVQQATVFLRSWMRVLAFASLSSYVRAAYGMLRRGEPLPAPSPYITRGV
jgi:hypothetical protein